MAELVKKLKLQNTKGTVESCTLYSTKEEANAMGGVLPLHVDGVDCFAALGAVTESEATSGRQEKNGVSLAILKQGGITPGSITVQGTGTFTVPKGVAVLQLTYLNVNQQKITSYVKVEAGKTYGYESNYVTAGPGGGVMVKTVFGNFTFQAGGIHGEPIGSGPLPITIAWSNSINKETPNGTA
ncbi:hypothetical protein [Selenomonas noxia]|uniref:hypothetical protein n=1 Tax=Selenomonas noxia TaxID=135083 RepID=UPI0023F42B07|nr:hypothetical protein [Selenomonas noxia]